GMLYDGSIGWYVTPNRLYRAPLAYWNRVDPAMADGLNWYVPFAGNPINSTDPTGMWKQVGSKSANRATWKSEEGDTLAGLAKKVELSTDVTEINHWLKGKGPFFKGSQDVAAVGSLIASDTTRKLCPGEEFTVPNVYIAANLLQGGGIYHQMVGIGGAVGMAGANLGHGDKKIVEVKTFGDLLNVIKANQNDIWGAVIYGHGNTQGYLGNDLGNFGYQDKVVDAFAAQQFKLAMVEAMQCDSFSAGTKEPGGPAIDWEAEWKKVAIKAKGYKGLNVLGFDLGS
ncbi:MAG: hypothetical protein ABJA67_03605, partial [Chthonomonadales bacterium]